MAKGQSTEQERTQNLRDVQGSRPSQAKGKVMLGVTPRPGSNGKDEIVKREIIRVLGNDRRLALVGDNGAEFLMSMGLTVTDAADRAQLLVLSLPWTMTTRRRGSLPN
jgi:hypothetical protein